MDYASLRSEGIRLLERMAGGQWTDFNVHDPGITLLEQLCYALTDLGYRAGYELPDLLADGGSDPYRDLHPPSEILTCKPVTQADLRRMVLDVEGVNNAWVEGATGSERLPVPYYAPDKNTLSLVAASPPSQPMMLRGLHRVLIEAKEGTDGSLLARVAKRLYASRGLCEDFAEIRVLDPQLIQVEATVEIGQVDDLARLCADIEQRLAEAVAPPVVFTPLGELLRAGRPPDELFEGPRLSRGFLSDEVLRRATRRQAVNTSDLIHAIMSAGGAGDAGNAGDAAGVRAVRRIRIASGGRRNEPWSLPVDRNKVPRLDRAGLSLTLTRDGTPVPRPIAQVPAAVRPSTRPADMEALLPPRGSDRKISRYGSVQHHLPALYGVGEQGLPDSAPAERKAQARQLKAYLLFFDQLMANYLAQLAHVKDLFALDGADERTYFTQAADPPRLGPDEIRIADRERAVLSAQEDGGVSRERKSRFQNHLLARFAETLDEHGALSGPRLLRNKQTFLRRYPWLGGARGTGPDCLGSGEAERTSGLMERVRLKLGLIAEDGETFLLIEHILLRPMEGDEQQQTPLLCGCLDEDPYSLLLTFVFPYGAGRFPKGEADPGGLRSLIEQTLRRETPAHLTPYICWLSAPEFQSVQAAQEQWQEHRRTHLAELLRIGGEEAGVAERAIPRHLYVRDARDRILDLLGIGETFPLRDVRLRETSVTVDYDTPSVIRIEPGQLGVLYVLYEGESQVQPPSSVVGNGGLTTLPVPPLTKDRIFRVRATKMGRSERSVFLLQSASFKVGLDIGLRAYLLGTPTLNPALVEAPDTAPRITDYGSMVSVRVAASQAGASYSLLYTDGNGAAVTTPQVPGTGGDIDLSTGPVTEDTQIRIRVRRTFDPLEGRSDLEALLKVVLTLAVRANPSVAVSLVAGSPAGSPIVDPTKAAAAAVRSSQRGVEYSAYVRPLRDPDFGFGTGSSPIVVDSFIRAEIPGSADVPEHPVFVRRPPRTSPFRIQSGYVPRGSPRIGNGELLQLDLDLIQEDSIVVIQAAKQHRDPKTGEILGSSTVQLEQAVVTLPRPAPVPELTLTVSPATPGSGARLLVSGGQPGVFYHFRAGPGAPELGLPAYFHRVDEQDAQQNRGLDQLRVATDFAITRTPPVSGDLVRQRPLPPLVELQQIPVGTTLIVTAVWARTGVAWLEPRSVEFTRT